jgi:hypothetical protein
MRITASTHRRRAFTFVDLLVVIATLLVLAFVLPDAMLGRRRGCGSPQLKCMSNLKQIGLGFRGWAQDNDDRYPVHTRGLTNLATGVLISGNTATARAWMHFLLLSNELSSARLLACRSDFDRLQNSAEDFSAFPTGLAHASKRDQALSYFVGLPAEELKPTLILGGDRNVASAETQRPFGATRATGVRNVPTTSAWSAVRDHQLHNVKSAGGNLLMSDGSVQRVSTSGLQALLTKAAQTNGPNANLFLFPK